MISTAAVLRLTLTAGIFPLHFPFFSDGPSSSDAASGRGCLRPRNAAIMHIIQGPEYLSSNDAPTCFLTAMYNASITSGPPEIWGTALELEYSDMSVESTRTLDT